MEHNDIRHKLSEYLDSSISAREKTEIENHLKTCRQCSDALEELRKTLEHIKSIEEIDPPAWMTQKIMAKVRAGSEEKKSVFQKLFYPLSVKLPIQALAIVFLTITAFYMYRNIQPSTGPSEAPIQEFAAGRKAAKDELAKAADHSLRAKQVPQAQEYKALDMKQEYEKPPLPMLQDQATAPASAPAAPARSAEQPISAQGEAASGKDAATQAAAPSMKQGQTVKQTADKSRTELKETAEATSHNTSSMRSDIETIIVDRYQNKRPKLLETYMIIDSRKVKRTEERFNSNGLRHGIQKEYYASGQLKTEAEYGNGKLNWYMEFLPDGVKKIGKTDFDWYWLKK